MSFDGHWLITKDTSSDGNTYELNKHYRVMWKGSVTTGLLLPLEFPDQCFYRGVFVIYWNFISRNQTNNRKLNRTPVNWVKTTEFGIAEEVPNFELLGQVKHYFFSFEV